MQKFEVDDDVWITHRGRVYSGKIIKIFEDPQQGTAVSVITDGFGYRTVLIEDCSYTKPKRKRKTLSAALKES